MERVSAYLLILATAGTNAGRAPEATALAKLSPQLVFFMYGTLSLNQPGIAIGSE